MVTDVAFIDVQLRVALWPAVILPGWTDNVTVGTIPPIIRLVEVPPPQPKKDEISKRKTGKVEDERNPRIQ
jgi:hypothetical protein